MRKTLQKVWEWLCDHELCLCGIALRVPFLDRLYFQASHTCVWIEDHLYDEYLGDPIDVDRGDTVPERTAKYVAPEQER